LVLIQSDERIQGDSLEIEIGEAQRMFMNKTFQEGIQSRINRMLPPNPVGLGQSGAMGFPGPIIRGQEQRKELDTRFPFQEKA
jgi:hypothetical protein